MEKVKILIVYVIAIASGFWLAYTFLGGIPEMGDIYLDGDRELAAMITFAALLGVFGPKVYLESLKEKK